jgi:hypothetical protein
MIIDGQQLGKQLFASEHHVSKESVAKQWRGKQASSTIQPVFSVGSVQSCYKRS